MPHMPPENRPDWRSRGREGKRQEVGVMPKPVTEDPGLLSVIAKVLKSGSARVPDQTGKIHRRQSSENPGLCSPKWGTRTQRSGFGPEEPGQAGRGRGPGDMASLCRALPERG